MQSEKIVIYTDGAARGNPGKAGWAAVILFQNYGGQGRVFEIGGKVVHATNNQMELTAVIEALKYLEKNPYVRHMGNVEIFCDSQYVIFGITEWIQNWIKKNWRNAAKKPVINRELWEKLYELDQAIKPKWTYVEGHNNNKWNDRADEIATSFADGEPVKLKTEHHAG